MDIVVQDQPERSRYEISVGGELGGFTEYELDGERISFIHTEIDSAFEGKGLGSKLVSQALTDVRDRGLSVLPFCPFVRSYIARHPEFVHLVPVAERARFDLQHTASCDQV